jgi:hypothetical protein
VLSGRRKRVTVLARFRSFGPLLLMLFAASCFEYGGSPRDHIGVGHDVRVTLTPDARTTLASRVGAQVRAVNGIVRSADSSGMQLALSRTTLLDGTEASWNGDTVTIPAADIAGVEQRKMSAPKTALVIGIIAGVTAILALSIGLSSSSSQNGSQSGSAK